MEGYSDGRAFIPLQEIIRLHHVSEEFQEVDAVSCLTTRSLTDEPELRRDIKIENMPNVLVELLDLWKFNTRNLPEGSYINAADSKVYEPK